MPDELVSYRVLKYDGKSHRLQIHNILLVYLIIHRAVPQKNLLLMNYCIFPLNSTTSHMWIYLVVFK